MQFLLGSLLVLVTIAAVMLFFALQSAEEYSEGLESQLAAYTDLEIAGDSLIAQENRSLINLIEQQKETINSQEDELSAVYEKVDNLNDQVDELLTTRDESLKMLNHLQGLVAQSRMAGPPPSPVQDAPTLSRFQQLAAQQAQDRANRMGLRDRLRMVSPSEQEPSDVT